MQQQGMIDAKQLEELADAGEIDTVLCMFTDFQGRFVGKRILPHFFLEDVLGRGGPPRVPVPDRDRHGDGAAARLRVRELGDRLRRLQDDPGHVDDAARAVAREDRDGDLRRRRRAHRASWSRWRRGRSCAARWSGRRRPATRSRPDRSSSSTSSRSPTKRRPRSATRDFSPLAVHHGLPHARDHQGRVADPPDPQRHAARAGIPIEFSKGEFGQGPARDQHHLRGRAGDRRLPRPLQARHEGDRRAERRRDHVHGEVDHGRGRLLLPHALERVERGRNRVADVGRRRPEPHEPDRSSTCSAG